MFSSPNILYQMFDTVGFSEIQPVTSRIESRSNNHSVIEKSKDIILNLYMKVIFEGYHYIITYVCIVAFYGTTFLDYSELSILLIHCSIAFLKKQLIRICQNDALIIHIQSKNCASRG